MTKPKASKKEVANDAGKALQAAEKEAAKQAKAAEKEAAKAAKQAAKDAAKATKEAEKVIKAQKPPKPEREVSNGVKKPLPGTKCWKVWDLISKVGAQIGETPSIGEIQQRATEYLNEDGTVEALNPGNVNAEYNQFRKFYGLPKVGRTTQSAK